MTQKGAQLFSGPFTIKHRNHHGRESKGNHHKSYRGKRGDMDVSGYTVQQRFIDDANLVDQLKVYAEAGDLYNGSQLHANIVEKGLLKKNSFIGNTLIHMYVKCGALSKAKEVFDELPVRTIVSWNALIAGYAQQVQGEDALACFERMQGEGLSPTEVTFACLVKACGSIGAVDKGEAFHAEVARMGWLGDDIVLGCALVDMYVKFGLLTKAREVFDELPAQNVVSWTALIKGYCQFGYNAEALDCFKQMRCEGLTPDAVTLACILKACGSAGKPEKGNQVHAEVVRKGLLGVDSLLGGALVNMYAKCGALTKAKEVFNELAVRDVIPWSALIAGFSENGHGKEALHCYEQMLHEGLLPDAVTFACVLKACGSIGAAEKGIEIHADVILNGLLQNSSILGNALVDMYARCGVLERAELVFQEHPTPNVISWTSLMAGYCQHGQCELALSCYDRMKGESLSPNAVTLACILKACGSLGATEKGEEVHVEIVRKDLLGVNTVMGSALIDMYTKCGALARAREVCEELPVRDVVSWSTLISGYCEHGHGEEALNCFEQLTRDGLFPDAITFACVLKACSRMGAAEKGQLYFETMSANFGVVPTPEHHTCMVDLFCHAGLFDKAMAVIDKMPSLDYLPAWCALMDACRKWGNVQLGRLVFQHAVQLVEKASLQKGSTYMQGPSRI